MRPTTIQIALYVLGLAILFGSQIATAQATKAPTKAAQTKAPSSEGKWEDAPLNTTLSFSVNVAGTNFDVTTVTIFDGDDFSTTISVQSARNAWIGILLGTSMIGGTAIIGLDPADASNAQLNLQAVNLYTLRDKDFNVANTVAPLSGGLEQNGISDASFTIVGGQSVLKFTLTKSQSTNFAILGNAPASLVTVSFVTGAAQTLTYHQGYAFQQVAFSTAEDGSSPIGTQAVTIEISFALAYHIVFMIMAWIFILPCGASIALTRLRRGPKASGRWFKYHRAIQMIGVAIGFAGWIAGIVHLDDFGTPHLSKGHHIFGYSIGAISLIQIVNGLMRPHAPEQGQEPTKERKRWFLSHRSIACFVLLAGITNCLIGASVLQDILGGSGTILVFPGTGGIVVGDFVTITLVLGILGYVALILATLVEPCRRRREGRDGDYPSNPQNDQYPSKPDKAAFGGMMSPYGGNDMNGGQGMSFGGGGLGPSGGQGFMQPPPRTQTPYGGGGGGNQMPYGGGGGGGGMDAPLKSFSPSAPFGGGGGAPPRLPKPPQGPQDYGYSDNSRSAPPPNSGYDMPSRSKSPEPNSGYQAPSMGGQSGYPQPPPRTMAPLPPPGAMMGPPPGAFRLPTPSGASYGGGDSYGAPMKPPKRPNGF